MSPQPGRLTIHQAVRWAVVLGVMALTLGILQQLRGCAKEVAGSLGKSSPEAIAVRLLTLASEIHKTQRLQVVEIKEVQEYRVTEEWTFLLLHRQTTSVIRVPLTLPIWIDLGNKSAWGFRLDGNILRVTAPPPQAGNPAPDLKGLEIRTDEGSVWLDDARARQEALNHIAGPMEEWAKTQPAKVRDQARGQVATFVRQWLGQAYKDSAGTVIQVRFSDERP